ncbi:Uncharacterized protein FWK35_00007961 [Aphis craccivora]|uniref:Uncharacterized protein n=1 Tax=Aphis craccivora TaxID=307492 RepID=A0A6G0YY75_APHCR|nr:Uncharacterized protein FWK35_00007961 [Aphis craccivora]
MLYATEEPQKIANIFNTFFVDIGSKLAENNIVEVNPIEEVIQLNGNSVEDKRINRAYNAPVAYTNTSYGQRFLDYQGPTIFNSMNNELKNTICVTPNRLAFPLFENLSSTISSSKSYKS